MQRAPDAPTDQVESNNENRLFRSLVGQSTSIREVRSLVEKVASSDSTVLLLGETGTGKEVVARNIHYFSDRRANPFVAINCAAIPQELLESELFGHERGAFTGALTTRVGRFELANGGTLFLDEIGDMGLSTQVKLLRVLQERRVDRVGATHGVEIDVRVIAATHQNLETMVGEGRFREDLYYRLNVVPIRMPPLRERREDIPLLISELNARLGARDLFVKRIGDEAMKAMLAYDWPGNVRELANVMERFANLVSGREVRVQDLPQKIQRALSQSETDSASGRLLSIGASCVELMDSTNLEFRSLIESIEVCLIRQALEDSSGNVTKAAKQLGLRRSTLVDKVRKFGLKPAGEESTKSRH